MLAMDQCSFRFPLAVAAILILSIVVLHCVHKCFSMKLQLWGDSQKVDTVNVIVDGHSKSSEKKKDFNSSGSGTLIEQLQKLRFLNSGLVKNTDEFVWLQQKISYLESQNVSGPYVGWADVHAANYLFKHQGEIFTDPPSGIRSSVPLGGKIHFNLYDSLQLCKTM